VVLAKKQILRTFVPEKVLLSADLRILPEPLRRGLFLALTGFQLLLPGWRGYFLSWLALVWIANIYMSLFGRLRLDIRHERMEIENTQKETQGTAQAGNRADA
jgi:hypothetical protein